MSYEYDLSEISKVRNNLAGDIKSFRETLEKKMEQLYEKCENENIYEAKLDDYFMMKASKVKAFAMSFEPFVRLIDKEATFEENYSAESLFKDWLRAKDWLWAKGDLTKMLAIIYQLERGYAFCLKEPDNRVIEQGLEGNENTN